MSIHERLGYNFPHDHTIIQLVNINSSCYINSVLQSLFNLPSIQKYLEFVSQKINEHNISIEDTLFGLFVKIYIDSQRAPQNEVWYEPNYFLDKFFSVPSQFERHQMCDSNEFFLTILDRFDTDILSINERINGQANFPRNDHEYSKNSPIRSFSSFFYFRVENRSNPNYPDFHNVAPIETYDMIIVRPDCEGTERAIIDFFSSPFYRRMLNLPEVFIVNINAFGFGDDGKSFKKFDKTPIKSEVKLTTRGFNGENADGEEAVYDLVSTVVHNGVDFDSGHFICVFKACGRVIVGDDANFWGLNDEQLRGFVERNEIPGSETCSAIYSMFYQKRM